MTDHDTRPYMTDHELSQLARKARDFPVPSETAWRKDDAAKLPLHLLPPDALEKIAVVLDYGQKKYVPRNWEKGMDWSRVYGAALRHLFAWWRGEKADPETGFSHLWHTGCCVLFLISYEERKIGKDDRP